MASDTRSVEVHPTAEVHPSAHLGEGVRVEAGAFVGPGCVVGPRTRIGRQAVLHQRVTMGADNVVHPLVILGADPQDRAYSPSRPGSLRIGDRNTFFEFVTISRSTDPTGDDPRPTTIGDGNMFMTSAHAGHNVVVGSNCVLGNWAALAGHSRLADGVTMSVYTSVHQFCRVGEGAMFQAYSGASQHAPPFVILTMHNQVAGLNRVGMRRNPALTAADRTEIKAAFRAIYRSPGPMAQRVAAADAAAASPGARRFVEFFLAALRDEPPFRRGVVGPVRGRRRLGATAEAMVEGDA